MYVAQIRLERLLTLPRRASLKEPNVLAGLCLRDWVYFTNGSFCPVGSCPVGRHFVGSFSLDSYPVGSHPVGSYPVSCYPVGSYLDDSFAVGAHASVLPALRRKNKIARPQHGLTFSNPTCNTKVIRPSARRAQWM